MDLRMPDLDGAEATAEIHRSHPSIRVLALTAVSEEAAVTSAMRAGASGFLAKDTPVGEVLAAVRAAAGGVAWLSPRAAEVILGQHGTQSEGTPALVRLWTSCRRENSTFCD